MKKMYAVLEHKTERFISFLEAGYGDGFQETPLFESKDDAEEFFNHVQDYTEITPTLVVVSLEETC